MGKRFIVPATLLCDFYKIGHKDQYPKNTQKVYSTWIPRTSRLAFADKVVAFGFQSFIKKYLINYFNESFFERPLEEVVAEYTRVIRCCLGITDPDASHITALHKLGYLPLLIKAVPEGTLVPLRVPMLTIENTHEDFGWLTNYVETISSSELWQSATSATIALAYRRVLDKYAGLTSDMPEFVDFQGHDFSFRGMSSLDSAINSGMGHLLPFVGSDTIPAILGLEFYYNADMEKELVGCSVSATEHSIQSAGGAGPGEEEETYRRLITEVYPTGIVSIVSDTWDLWNVLTKIIPNLKAIINGRDGKVVIRPDSGDPVDILCGTARNSGHPASTVIQGRASMHNNGYTVKHGNDYYMIIDNVYTWVDPTPAMKGVIQLLWETFGGRTNAKGFKQLSDKVGAIYGDAITVARATEICQRLMDKGFASTNIVLGIGSYTYQYNTRDTFGFAMKATHCVIDGKEVNIFKDPATDDGTKKSLTGRCVVLPDLFGDLYVLDDLTQEQEGNFTENLLKPIFKDGTLLVDVSLSEIRAKLK